MEKVAIIGTGISGMAAGYFLKDRYDITFYEKNDYPGGHTNTLTIDEDGQPIYIDSGFIVYNEKTYPNLTRLFRELNVETKATDMSFSVQHVASGLEFCGTGLSGLFAQKRNVFNYPFLRMLFEISRFHKEADRVLSDEKYLSYSVRSYAQEHGYQEDFIQKFLLPMSSAVWSSPPDKMLDFPIVSLVRFFTNHCFLGLEGHLPWRTVVGGSRQYRDRILKYFDGNVWLNRGVSRVVRTSGQVQVKDSTGQTLEYDKVIVACHADEALALLADPTEAEKTCLSAFLYQPNHAVLHTDATVMPKKRKAWSSWNYRIGPDREGRTTATTIYDMNNLQGVSKKKNYFISINDPGLIDPAKKIWERWYTHPLYTVEGIQAQKRLPELNQSGPVYFCGSYFNYGFHEDGLTAGLKAARALAGMEVWS